MNDEKLPGGFARGEFFPSGAPVFIAFAFLAV